AAIFIFEPLVQGEDPSLDLCDLYSQAMLAAERYVDSEPLIWRMFEQNPARIEQVVNLIGKMIDSQLDEESVVLARKLDAFQRRVYRPFKTFLFLHLRCDAKKWVLLDWGSSIIIVDRA
ncbi:MAG TPA: hypothetical protein VGD64_04410, partial [Acidisarcina sp.]